jgi:hypothetical protein
MPQYGGATGSPEPGAGGRAVAHLVDQEYGRALAEYVVAEATRRTIAGETARGSTDRFVRWQIMLDVLESSGIGSIRGRTIQSIKLQDPGSGPAPILRELTSSSERETTTPWMAAAITKGLIAGRGNSLIPMPENR